MALIICRECGREISDQASACIHCGYPAVLRTANHEPLEFTGDKIREINGVVVNIDELIREHGTDKISTVNHLREITGVPLTESRRIVDIAHRKRGIKQPGFWQQVVDQAKPIQSKDEKKLQKLELQSKKLAVKYQKQELKDQKKTARCPRCGSTSLSAHKKGFGVGKGIAGALAGAAISSPLGLLGATAGNIGAKKVRVTCLNCGKQFKA